MSEIEADGPPPDPDLVRLLSQLYERPFDRAREVVHGVNHTFEAWSNHDQFFFRLYHPTQRADSDLDFEIESLLHAARSESDTLGISSPVLSGLGTYINRVTLHGVERRSCLYVAAAGRALEETPPDLFAFGAALGELHAAMAGFVPRNARLLRLGSRIGETLEALAAKPLLQPLRQAIAANRQLWEELPDGWTSGFCHGDARLGNALIDGKRVTLFDFDDCAIGPQVFDLSTPIWWLWRRNRASAGQLLPHFLNGYRSRRALAKADLALLPRMVAMNGIRALHSLIVFDSLRPDLWEWYQQQMLDSLNDWTSGVAANELALDQWRSD